MLYLRFIYYLLFKIFCVQERMLESFSKKYVADNPNTFTIWGRLISLLSFQSCSLPLSTDQVFMVVYSLMMVQSFLHNPNASKTQKATV